jgi:hypothetical protein
MVEKTLPVVFPVLTGRNLSQGRQKMLERCFRRKNSHGVKPACCNDWPFGLKRFRPAQHAVPGEPLPRID